jgi:hypothetical protein
LQPSPGAMLDDQLLVSKVHRNILAISIFHDPASNCVLLIILLDIGGLVRCIKESSLSHGRNLILSLLDFLLNFHGDLSK